MKPKALFCICSLGLGHATRSLPIIHSYLPSHDIHIVSYGNALAYLKKDLAGQNVQFHEVKDYPPLERGKGWKAYWYIVIDSFHTVGIIHREHVFVKKLVKKIKPDFIISDGRYGSHVKSVPSFIITHQVSFVMPRGLKIFQKVADYFNYRIFNNFDALLIPDYESHEQSLSGKLSHHPMLKKLNHHYIGILSSLKKNNVTQDIDFLFTISGYLHEHKESFVSKLLEQAKKMPGKKVFILGNAKDETKQVLENGTIEIYGSASYDLKQDLFNRAKCVVSRSGYTTIMDLVELDKTGFLIPTPGQTEQEYLAKYLNNRFFTAPSNNFDLSTTDFNSAPKEIGQVLWKTETSVRMIREIVKELAQPNFFSIVIPVHNEEKLLGKTLTYIDRQNYSREYMEVIIVENGSTDRSLEIARSYENRGFKVYTSEKGVSKAKNFGIGKVSEKSNWIVLLDADTFIKPSFLADLNKFFKSKRHRNFSIGTTTVLPDEKKHWYAGSCFGLYNCTRFVSKTSFAIQIMNAKYRHQVKFDENKTFAEDLKFIKDLREFGWFFYFKTRTVATSTRRFDETGWFKLFFKWNWQALILSHFKIETKHYEVIR